MGFHNTALIGASGQGGYNLESSLRFRSSASPYLTRTFGVPTDPKKYTISFWFKRGTLGVLQDIISAFDGVTTYPGAILINANDTLGCYMGGAAANAIITTQVFRDPSAWYHIVFSVDAANTTCSLQINGGTAITATVANVATQINANGRVVRIGSYFSGGRHIDGYLTEFNFIDGQALTADDFGETDDTTGVWKPKEYTGTYGTNGFYLPMKETQQATGFNTVLYTGNGTSQDITGVGFTPDLVWHKGRSVAYSHGVVDSVRGDSNVMFTNATSAESNPGDQLDIITDGFTTTYRSANNANNQSGQTYVAWCWDAGSSTVSNTDGTITSSVRANPATGFSIVTWTGNGSAGATIGHGLGSTPQVIINKGRSYAQNWAVYHSALGPTKWLQLNSTVAQLTETAIWNDTSPTSSIFTVGSSVAINPSGGTNVAYCFSEVAGYSKFGSYTGNGSVGNSVTGLGFEPAFLLIKNATDLGGSGESWYLYDNARDPVDTRYHKLNPNDSGAESTSTVNNLVDFDSDGFTIQSTNAGLNYNGDTYIYMAFADTRDAQFNFDASGNKNNWTANNINSNASSETTYDIINDVPTLTDEDTSNFAIWNPLPPESESYSSGNLDLTGTSISNRIAKTTVASNTGKFYWEYTITSASNTFFLIGVASLSATASAGAPSGNSVFYRHDNGYKYVNGTGSSYGASWTTGDVISVALDLDANTVVFYKNNTSQGSISLSADTYTPAVITNAVSGHTLSLNCGQRPFKYTPPAGYLKLNTYNLPDSTIVDGSQYFYAQTYTGDGTLSRSFTGLPFTPDLIWNKDRTNAYYHRLHDSVRGIRSELYSNAVDPEADNYSVYGSLTSFDTNGYTVSTGGLASNFIANTSGSSLVSWLWRGSDSSAVSNTDGTITSTVSANPTSGFSIVTWTGDGGSNQSVGHGLSEQPDMVIVKKRNKSENWYVASTSSGYDTNFGYHLHLNTTGAVDGNNDPYYLNSIGSVADKLLLANGTSNNGGNENGINYVAYCWHSVEGFSKIGSYTGNGSADGPFVYTGFRPVWILEKNTNAAYGWLLWDTSRSSYNMVTKYLVANTSDAEADTAGAQGPNIDILSNGFKVRDPNAGWNQSGSTHIYMAFAENPFKNSLAR